MTGKEFEALIIFRAGKLEEEGVLSLGRYGVQAVMMNGPDGKPGWQIIKSLPDFEGTIPPNGQQIIIEAKVCSQASYPIASTDRKHPKQIDHMMRRARMGARCFLLIHFNPRELKTRNDPAETYAIPVHPDNYFWRMFDAAEERLISRAMAAEYGITVPWNLYSTRASKQTPDLTALLEPAPFQLQ